jgi:hypothetical protein
MGQACIRTGESRGSYKVLVGRHKGKKPLEKPRRRWVNSFKISLQEEGYGSMDLIDRAQDRDSCRALLNEVMNLWVPKKAGNLLTG